MSPELPEQKTHLCHIEEGFDFLGFNVRKYKQKLLITPSRAKVASFMKRIRDYIKSNIAIQAGRFLRGLNSRLRGFANFYRHVVSKRTFNEIDQRVYQLLRDWMHRRHRNKTHAWCKQKYIKRWGTRWQFTVSTVKDRKVRPVRLFKVADLPIIRHIKVKGVAHPYNPLYAEYFEQRRYRQWQRRKTDGKFLATLAIERMV
jgi:RNA-directed DNA polymerase